MENLLLIIVVLLSLLVFGLFIAIALLGYKIIIKKDKAQKSDDEGSIQNPPSNYPPEVMELINQAKAVKESVGGQFCIDHPELFAKGLCSISNLPYCELCLTKEEEVKVARKYLDMLLDSTWDTLYMLNTEAAGADKLNMLFGAKKKLWEEEIPLLVHRQFKINIENDKIETYTFVKARHEDKAKVQAQISFLAN